MFDSVCLCWKKNVSQFWRPTFKIRNQMQIASFNIGHLSQYLKRSRSANLISSWFLPVYPLMRTITWREATYAILIFFVFIQSILLIWIRGVDLFIELYEFSFVNSYSCFTGDHIFHVLIMGVDVALNYSSIGTCRVTHGAGVTHQDAKQVQWVFQKILPWRNIIVTQGCRTLGC